MSILIKGLNIKPCKDGFDGKGLVIIGYDDKLYAVAHEQIIPLPNHGELIDRDALIEEAKILGTVTCHQPFDFPYGCNLVEWCKAAETVIPAERSEE